MNPKIIPEKRLNLQFLDGLRGLAALYVMIGHARWILWEGWSNFIVHANSYSNIEKFQAYFMLIFKYGHQMVLFFFVLSGFVIHLRYAKNIQSNPNFSFDFANYYQRRIKRILPPFLIAILLTFLLDKVTEWSSFYIYHGTTSNPTLNKNIKFDHSLSTLLGNIFFLQDSYVPVFGSNGPLWSLKYEWWFYVCYPLLYVLNRRYIVGTLLLLLIGALAVSFGLQTKIILIDQILAYFFSWWLGTFAADIFVQRIRLKKDKLSYLTLILLLIPFSSLIPNSLGDNIVAIGFFGMLIMLLNLHEKGYSFKLLTKLKWLGDCSYTLYVTHFPILVLYNGYILNESKNVLPRSFIHVWIGICLTLVVAFLLHFISEKPFTRQSIKLRRSLIQNT